MGFYASRSRFIVFEYLNGDYKGIYVLMEKIKPSNQIDISKLETDEIDGDDLTGGYIQ